MDKEPVSMISVYVILDSMENFVNNYHVKINVTIKDNVLMEFVNVILGILDRKILYILILDHVKF
jgi:hypothetical protein